MSTFAPKPWNDLWTRAAMKTRSYKVYSCGHHDAGRMSWRRLKKLFKKGGRLGRAERRIVRATQ